MDDEESADDGGVMALYLYLKHRYINRGSKFLKYFCPSGNQFGLAINLMGQSI